MLELLDRITQADLENPKLFACTSAALCALDGADALHAPAISAAHLLKTFAFAGVRPTLDSCCLCGQPIDVQQADAQAQGIAFSYAEGGVECQACVTPDAVRINAATISWARALLGMRFSDIAHADIDQSSVFGVTAACARRCRHARIHEPQLAGVPVHLRIVLGDVQEPYRVCHACIIDERGNRQTYQPCGVCSREIHIDLDGDTIKHVDFVGGTNGNPEPSTSSSRARTSTRWQARA